MGYTCVRLGKAGKHNAFLNVEAKGGLLQVKVEPDDTIILKGPAATAYEGIIDLPEDLLK